MQFTKYTGKYNTMKNTELYRKCRTAMNTGIKNWRFA